MYLAKLFRILFLLFLILVKPALAKEEDDKSINNETLTGGIVANEGYYLAKSTKIPVTLRTPIDTRINSIGDLVTAQTTEPMMIGAHELVPARSFLHGYITHIEGPGRFHKAPSVNISFDTLSLPGTSGKRRKVHLVAEVNPEEVLKQAERVNDGATYKKRLRTYGTAGAAVGALALHGATRNVPSFSVIGITALSDFAYLAGGAIGGAAIAAAVLKKDDIRLEPGTELVVTVNSSTMDNFAQEHPLSNDNIKKLSPEEAYDAYMKLKAEPYKSQAKGVLPNP